jgi:hypothetical protein
MDSDWGTEGPEETRRAPEVSGRAGEGVFLFDEGFPIDGVRGGLKVEEELIWSPGEEA